MLRSEEKRWGKSWDELPRAWAVQAERTYQPAGNFKIRNTVY